MCWYISNNKETINYGLVISERDLQIASTIKIFAGILLNIEPLNPEPVDLYPHLRQA